MDVRLREAKNRAREPNGMAVWPLRTNIYVRIISVLLLVTQETELCL